MTTKTPLDRARILVAHARWERDKNFLQSFLKDTELQGQLSAQNHVAALWARFLQSPTGKSVVALETAKPPGSLEEKLLRTFRAKLEKGGRLTPYEQDQIESWNRPVPKTTDPETLSQVHKALECLVPLMRADRDTAALCGHLQQWLRKQGRR